MAAYIKLVVLQFPQFSTFSLISFFLFVIMLGDMIYLHIRNLDALYREQNSNIFAPGTSKKSPENPIAAACTNEYSKHLVVRVEIE